MQIIKYLFNLKKNYNIFYYSKIHTISTIAKIQNMLLLVLISANKIPRKSFAFYFFQQLIIKRENQLTTIFIKLSTKFLTFYPTLGMI
jgi:hypothetical protein